MTVENQEFLVQKNMTSLEVCLKKTPEHLQPKNSPLKGLAKKTEP